MFDNAYALIIGIAHYRHINQLGSTLADAQDIHDLLIDDNFCGYQAARVTLLQDQAADRDAILKALDELAARVNSESTVFIFLACHGGRLLSGPYAGQYILPVDVDYESGESIARTAISGELFTAKLRNIKVRKLTVILDCCHAGGIGQPRQVGAPALKRGLSDDFHQQLALGQGRVIMGSASEDEAAWEMTGDRNGLFTKHLLAGLRGKASGDDEFIRVFQLYDYVQRQVVKEKATQNPLFKAEARDNFPLALRLGGQRGIAAATTDAPRSKVELLQLLGRMQRAEFEEVLFRIDMPKRLRPSKDLPQGERAVVLIDWALDAAEVGIDGLRERVQQVVSSGR